MKWEYKNAELQAKADVYVCVCLYMCHFVWKQLHLHKWPVRFNRCTIHVSTSTHQVFVSVLKDFRHYHHVGSVQRENHEYVVLLGCLTSGTYRASFSAAYCKWGPIFGV